MEIISKSLSLTHFVKATSYAAAGVRYAFLNEPGFQRAVIIEITLAIVVGWFLWPLSTQEILNLAVAAVFVLIAEIVNTSIEKLVDMVQPEQDTRVKRIKDCAAGATLLATCFGVIILALVVYGHLCAH